MPVSITPMRGAGPHCEAFEPDHFTREGQFSSEVDWHSAPVQAGTSPAARAVAPLAIVLAATATASRIPRTRISRP